jgi:DNA-binding MarR family transcriptional regulator
MEGLSMSSGARKTREELLGELVRELWRFTGQGASFFRAAAVRTGMTVTDLEVIDRLDSADPLTAGQLAELTGLTTGAITGMINRLEEAGVVSRERDPDDGRRVIVRLAPDTEKTREVSAVFNGMGRAWNEIAAQYDDEQITFLLDFLKRGNTASREEIVRLRETPTGEEGSFSAPLGDLTGGRLVVVGAFRLNVGVDSTLASLYQARFEGPAPDVKAVDGVVTIRYPRRLLGLVGKQGGAEVVLNPSIPWRIAIQGAAAAINTELDGLDLAGMEVKGGMSSIHLELPTTSAVVPIRLSGGASEIVVRRPQGVAARVHLKGWVSTFIFDDQLFGNVGNDVRLQSESYEATAPYYDIEVASSASMVTITDQ